MNTPPPRCFFLPLLLQFSSPVCIKPVHSSPYLLQSLVTLPFLLGFYVCGSGTCLFALKSNKCKPRINLIGTNDVTTQIWIPLVTRLIIPVWKYGYTKARCQVGGHEPVHRSAAGSYLSQKRGLMQLSKKLLSVTPCRMWPNVARRIFAALPLPSFSHLNVGFRLAVIQWVTVCLTGRDTATCNVLRTSLRTSLF